MPPSLKRQVEAVTNSPRGASDSKCESGFEYDQVHGQAMILPPMATDEMPTPHFRSIPGKSYPFSDGDGVPVFRDFNVTDDSNIHLAVPPRKSYDHVKDKELRKKLKNRESAQAARDRKKAKMMFLERQVSDLIERNRYLEAENMELRKRIQIVESESFWRLKSENMNQYSTNPGGSPELQYPLSHDHMSSQPPHHPPCYPHFQNDIPASIMPGTGVLDKSHPPGTELNVNNFDPSGIQKCEGYPADNKSMSHQMQQYLMQDSTGESLIHNDARYTEHGFPVGPKIQGPNGNYSRGSECSSTSSRKTSDSAGENVMNAEDWLMLSFKPELQQGICGKESNSVNMTAESDVRSFGNTSSNGQEYSWEDMSMGNFPLGTGPHKTTGLSQGLDVADINGGLGVGYYHHENSFCDSSGVESMSSPDVSGGSAVSSPDGAGGFRQEFPADQHAFKVH